MKKHDINRTLVENTIRINLRNCENDPTRSIRRLVDIGKHFSKTILQTEIFNSLYNLFADNESQYFNCMNTLLASVSKDSLIRFGTNLGYDSFTAGSKQIKAFEKNTSSKIPWITECHINSGNIEKYSQDLFKNIVKICEPAGIYSYYFVLDELPSYEMIKPLFDTIREYSYYTFFVRLPDILISDEFMDEISTLPNMLTLIKYDGANSAALSEWFHEKMLLHGFYYIFNDENSDVLDTSDLADCFSLLSSPIVITIPEKNTSEEAILKMNNAIQKIRFGQHYPLLLVNQYEDIQNVNKIISGCSVDITFSPKLVSQCRQ